MYGSARMAERLGNCSRVMLERADDLRRKALNDMTKSVQLESGKKRGRGIKPLTNLVTFYSVRVIAEYLLTLDRRDIKRGLSFFHLLE